MKQDVMSCSAKAPMCPCYKALAEKKGAETAQEDLNWAEFFPSMICNCGNTSGWIVISFDGQNQPPEGCFNRVYQIKCPSCSEYVTTYQRRDSPRSPFKKGYEAETFEAQAPRGHKMMTAALGNKIPPLYSQDEKGDEAIVYAHYFNPYGIGEWWILEWDGKEEMFGYADLGFPELGYISLSELENISIGRLGLPLERDLHWWDKTLGEVKKSKSFSAESHAYSYAYNDGHSDSRNGDDYRPNLSGSRQEADFKKILKQKAEYSRDSDGRFSSKSAISLTTAAIIGLAGAYLWRGKK